MLSRLCDKGLVLDVKLGERYHYMPAPFVIGIFEFTMMRMNDSDENIGEYSRLFMEYLEEGDFYTANFEDGQQVTRAVLVGCVLALGATRFGRDARIRLAAGAGPRPRAAGLA